MSRNENNKWLPKHSQSNADPHLGPPRKFSAPPRMCTAANLPLASASALSPTAVDHPDTTAWASVGRGGASCPIHQSLQCRSMNRPAASSSACVSLRDTPQPPQTRNNRNALLETHCVRNRYHKTRHEIGKLTAVYQSCRFAVLSGRRYVSRSEPTPKTRSAESFVFVRSQLEFVCVALQKCPSRLSEAAFCSWVTRSCLGLWTPSKIRAGKRDCTLKLPVSKKHSLIRLSVSSSSIGSCSICADARCNNATEATGMACEMTSECCNTSLCAHSTARCS
eukprot:725525-Rhodomonas_salina.1